MMMNQEHEELVRRALAAWWKFSQGYQPQQPDRVLSTVEVSKEGLWYVALRNVNGILCVYRIANTGNLKRLVRIPRFLNEEDEGEI